MAAPWTVDVAAALGVAALFVASPWLVRVVLDTRRLPDGDLRAALLDVCGRHGVRVSDLLVWRTRGTMLNGAVVGLVPAIRYVLLTDALIQTLPREQLLAVMAHEVGHVRRRHMLVAALGLVACAALASMAVDGTLAVTLPHFDGFVQPASIDRWRDVIELGAVAIAGGLTLLAFGAVSRRLERQADVFAVTHLSHGWRRRDPTSAPAVASDAVETMCDALDAVCLCSGGDPRRRSWRHGSIAARQAYLRTLVGAPLRSLSIDRQVRWIAVASIVVVAAAVVVALAM